MILKEKKKKGNKESTSNDRRVSIALPHPRFQRAASVKIFNRADARERVRGCWRFWLKHQFQRASLSQNSGLNTRVIEIGESSFAEQKKDGCVKRVPYINIGLSNATSRTFLHLAAGRDAPRCSVSGFAYVHGINSADGQRVTSSGRSADRSLARSIEFSRATNNQRAESNVYLIAKKVLESDGNLIRL